MDIFNTATLNRVVEQIRPPSAFLLDVFFPEIETFDTEEIYFDVDDDKPRLAPFVHPLVAGQVVQSKGFQTNSFKPAYVKDKRVHRPDRSLRRSIGEAVGGSLSPDQRRAANVRRDLEDQLDMLTRRQVVMASEALRTGQVTVVGDKYPEKVVNFGRDAALSVGLTTTARWGESGVSPVDDLQSWIETVQDKSGAVPNVVVMDIKAWQLLKADPKFKDAIDTRRGGSSTAETGAITLSRESRARNVGALGDIGLWVYNESYIDPIDGTTKKVLPDHTVIIGDTISTEGVRAYGAILDEDAGIQARAFFSKSWLEQDPSVRYLLMQSAPLTVPYRPNATFCATVR
jgi:hypothetical protein